MQDFDIGEQKLNDLKHQQHQVRMLWSFSLTEGQHITMHDTYE